MAIGHTKENTKLHGFSKGERLCNFTLKNKLFKEGEVFHNFPLHFYWKLLDKNLAPLFANKKQLITNLEVLNESASIAEQNSLLPNRSIPANALFTHPVKCLIGVSKKNYRKAVDRNHLKRLLREAYRPNKHGMYSFLELRGKYCLLAIVYTGKSQLSFAEIERKIIVSLQKIQSDIEKMEGY